MNKKVKFDLTKFVSYDNETNLSTCLAFQCGTIFMGIKKFAIQRHYRVVHNIIIEEHSAEDVEIVEFDNSIIHNSDDDALNSTNQYDQQIDNDLLMNMDIKPYKKFIVADYVDYRPAEDISKCLIKNCERGLSGRRTGNIKRHYHRVHKFIIVHSNHNDDSDELEDYYENEEFETSDNDTNEIIKCETEEMNLTDANEDFLKTQSDVDGSDVSSHMRLKMILAKYVDYDPLTNKSRCLVPACKSYLEGKKLYNIKRHYWQVHNCAIESNKQDLKKLMTTHRHKVISPKKCSTPIEELVIYDADTNTYQCLFINCNLILEKNLATIKKHYREFHKIIIAKDSDDLDNHPLLKKRKYQHTYRMDQQQLEQQNCIVKEEPRFNFEQNEYITDNYEEEQPHCSTSKKQKYIATQEISRKIEISLTKQEFLKLCLGLIIESDVPLSLFNDNNYFKPLLAPYEQLFNCHLNSTVMETIMTKANDLIIDNLKKTFCNKVVCLEFLLLQHNKSYYLIFNVRYIEEGIVHNKLIGFIYYVRSIDIPIHEYLRKFEIDYKQLYMKTVTVTNSTSMLDDELISSCYKICKYNCEADYGPVYKLQKVLHNFIFTYKEDIEKWQIIAKFVDINFKDSVENFEKFKEFLVNEENDLKNKEELQNSMKFMKSIQICKNLIDKLNGQHYVVGDFYRDWLCCELELKELLKNDNSYAGALNDALVKCRKRLLDDSKFVSALYLDPRFSFIGSQILNEQQKTRAKNSLLQIHADYEKYLPPLNVNNDNLNVTHESNDDEYALLTQHINDTMPVKSDLCMQDKLNNCVSAKREPFNLDILKYWRDNRNDIHLNKLSEVTFIIPVSQYVSKYMEQNFTVPINDIEKFDKFLIKHNYDILEKNMGALFDDILF